MRNRPRSNAEEVASAASTVSRISRESDTLPRFSATVTGLTASTTAAVMPATGSNAPNRKSCQLFDMLRAAAP